MFSDMVLGMASIRGKSRNTVFLLQVPDWQETLLEDTVDQ